MVGVREGGPSMDREYEAGHEALAGAAGESQISWGTQMILIDKNQP